MFFSKGISSLRTHLRTRSRSVWCSSLILNIPLSLWFSNALVHEVERVGGTDVEPLGQDIDLDHRLIERAPAFIGHRADPGLQCVARQHDAARVHLLDGVGDA